MEKAIYGLFGDPITFAHLNIIGRALALLREKGKMIRGRIANDNHGNIWKLDRANPGDQSTDLLFASVIDFLRLKNAKKNA